MTNKYVKLYLSYMELFEIFTFYVGLNTQKCKWMLSIMVIDQKEIAFSVKIYAINSVTVVVDMDYL